MQKMGTVKSAFEWNDGTPSIWSRDSELRRKIQGQEWAKKAQAKKDINFKAQVFTYAKAVSGKG
jgi:hypothetical protein